MFLIFVPFGPTDEWLVGALINADTDSSLRYPVRTTTTTANGLFAKQTN